jgi:hypothetical protein
MDNGGSGGDSRLSNRHLSNELLGRTNSIGSFPAARYVARGRS